MFYMPSLWDLPCNDCNLKDSLACANAAFDETICISGCLLIKIIHLTHGLNKKVLFFAKFMNIKYDTTLFTFNFFSVSVRTLLSFRS